MKRKDFLLILLILASIAVGVVSSMFCGSRPSLLGLWSLIPFLWLETETRRAAFLVPFVFYLSMSNGIVPGAYVFFRDGSLVRALTLWLSSAAALAAPWWLVWQWSEKSKGRKAAGVVFALAASIPPPLGLIGWGNPLTAVGLFFPGWGWFGLALMLDLYAEAAQSRKLRRALMCLILIAIAFLNVPAVPERVTVGGVTIQGVNTSFGRMASGSGDFEAQYEREREVFQYIDERKHGGDFESADIVVLPETIIGRMNPTTIRRWEKFFAPFVDEGTVFIVGGEIPTNRGMKYDNVMVSFEAGGKRQTAKQRFPVPASMFVPFSGEGANAYMSSLGDVSVMEIHGRRLGFLICYEQFLTWPLLSLISQRPDVIAAPANLWWCKDTSLPGIRAAAMYLWSRLFSFQIVEAVNN